MGRKSAFGLSVQAVSCELCAQHFFQSGLDLFFGSKSFALLLAQTPGSFREALRAGSGPVGVRQHRIEQDHAPGLKWPLGQFHQRTIARKRMRHAGIRGTAILIGYRQYRASKIGAEGFPAISIGLLGRVTVAVAALVKGDGGDPGQAIDDRLPHASTEARSMGEKHELSIAFPGDEILLDTAVASEVSGARI